MREPTPPGDKTTSPDDSHPLSRREFLATTTGTAAGLMINGAAEAAKGKGPSGSKTHSAATTPPGRTLLVKHATIMVTMDDERREIQDGGLFIEHGIIKQIGPTSSLPSSADEVLDLQHHILLPGLINTHHHLYQHLTRVVPAAQDGNVMNWLKVLYPMWARIRPEALSSAIQCGLAELALSGCTTAFDHQYIFPNGCSLDDSIEAASKVGLRFHASRGSMSLGASKGGLPPDRCVEEEPAILKDSQRVIERYHDPKPGSMLQIALAPCSPFSVTQDLMIESARMARHYGVGLHTHLAESLDEERYTLDKYQLRPLALMEKLGWVGKDVWFAHSVHISDQEVALFAKTGCGVAHCPCSNMRLASGIAPIKKFRDAGVRVGLGVDGASSNDGSHLLAEARQAMLLARTLLSQNPGGPPADQRQWMSARDTLEMATRGGAATLGRGDIGSLEVGKYADFFAVDLNTIGFSGGASIDPVAALVFAASPSANYTVVHGRFIVKQGQLMTIDLPRIIESCNRAAAKIVNG